MVPIWLLQSIVGKGNSVRRWNWTFIYTFNIFLMEIHTFSFTRNSGCIWNCGLQTFLSASIYKRWLYPFQHWNQVTWAILRVKHGMKWLKELCQWHDYEAEDIEKRTKYHLVKKHPFIAALKNKLNTYVSPYQVTRWRKQQREVRRESQKWGEYHVDKTW